MSLVLYPAIDVRGGRVVRLRQGDYARETDYGRDPLALACTYAEAGAEWLHLVDLDAARDGGYALRGLVDAIRSASALRVQTGGGVRSREDVEALLAAGADRVVVGSMAVREPAMVIDWMGAIGPERLAIALDTRRDADGAWRLPSHGWTRSSSITLEGLADAYGAAGLRHLLCTDIARDGMACGPNVALYEMLCARLPGVCVQASGGVRGTTDLVDVHRAGCAGAVLGRSLLDGALSLEEARAC